MKTLDISCQTLRKPGYQMERSITISIPNSSLEHFILTLPFDENGYNTEAYEDEYSMPIKDEEENEEEGEDNGGDKNKFNLKEYLKSSPFIGVSIALHVGEKFRCLLFNFKDKTKADSWYGYPLEFVKELTVHEFKSIEKEAEYFVCRIKCKNLEKFSFRHQVIVSSTELEANTHSIDLK